MNAAYRGSRERLEQSPPARADGEPSGIQIRLELAEYPLGQSLSRAFQVEHQLGLAGCGREQLVQGEPRAPPASELPAIPENRDRPRRLQVSDFEPAPIEPDVSLYKGRLEALRGLEAGKAVPSTVRHEERARPAVVERRRGWPAHRPRV
jgi:hypothetical protein